MNFKTINSIAEFRTSAAIVSSVTAGSIFALYTTQKFDFLLFIAVLMASFLLDSAATIFNHYFDYKKAKSKTSYNYNVHNPIGTQEMLSGTAFLLGMAAVLIAGILGLYIVYRSSLILLLIGFISMVIVYTYSGGPRPISYTPFGELVSGFFEGTIVFGTAYFVQTGTYTFSTFLVSMILWITIGDLMFGNNLSDIEEDKINGRKTLPIVLGFKQSILVLIASYLDILLIIGLCIYLGYLPLFSGLILIIYPLLALNLKFFIKHPNKKEGFKKILLNSLLVNIFLSLSLIYSMIFY